MTTKIKPFGLDSTQDFTFDDVTANSVTISKGLNANGSLGTDGQLLTSNGSVAYWATSTAASTGKAIAMSIVFGG